MKKKLEMINFNNFFSSAAYNVEMYSAVEISSSEKNEK